MTRNQINNILEATAKEHGFEVWPSVDYHGLRSIRGDYLNFCNNVRITTNTDWKQGIGEQELIVTASISRSGGHPTTGELFKAADEIKRGAELIEDLETMHLVWQETF